MAEGAAEVSAASDGGGDLGTVRAGTGSGAHQTSVSRWVRRGPASSACQELGQRPSIGKLAGSSVSAFRPLAGSAST